jgi:hypothetical protein
MSGDYEKCERCGGKMKPVVGSRVGAMETWRCEHCGFETAMHILFVEDPEKRKDVEVDLVVYWHRVPPEAGELIALRKTFPQFADVPPYELAKRVGATSRFVVGVFVQGWAESLRREAVQNGLDVRIETHDQK